MPEDKKRIIPSEKIKINEKADIHSVISEEAGISSLKTDLNIVLTKDQINAIVRGVIGAKGEKFDPRAIASNYCCVDVSVGSSVASPVSSVASSVSVPNPENFTISKDKTNVLKKDLQQKIDATNANINIKLPENVKIK